jgi:hypothetical protein
MPDPILAVKKVLAEDWKFLEEKLRSANSELDSFLVFNFDIRKINRVVDSISQAKKGTRNLFNTGIVFSGEVRKNLGMLYAELRKIIDMLIAELKTLIEELRSCKGTSIDVQDKIQEIKKHVQTLSFKVSSFMHIISTSVSGITERIRKFDCHQTRFVSATPARDEYLIPFFYLISQTSESLQIMTPHIDEIHLRFLTYLKDCHNQPTLNLRLLLSREDPARGFIKNKDLPWFEVKVNYNIHGRIIISDNKLAMVSSADLQSITYSGHFEAGIVTNETELVSLCYDFFEKAWTQGMHLTIFDYPSDRSKVILQHDEWKSSKKLAICSEVSWAIQPVDPSYCFRIVTKKWGYVDSDYSCFKLNEVMKNFPEYRHVLFFSPILRILPIDGGDPEKLSLSIFEALNEVVEKGMIVDIRFYDIEREETVSDAVLEKIKKHLMEKRGCSFSEESKNRIIVFLHKNKYIVTFTLWEKSPI